MRLNFVDPTGLADGDIRNYERNGGPASVDYAGFGDSLYRYAMLWNQRLGLMMFGNSCVSSGDCYADEDGELRHRSNGARAQQMLPELGGTIYASDYTVVGAAVAYSEGLRGKGSASLAALGMMPGGAAGGKYALAAAAGNMRSMFTQVAQVAVRGKNYTIVQVDGKRMEHFRKLEEFEASQRAYEAIRGGDADYAFTAQSIKNDSRRRAPGDKTFAALDEQGDIVGAAFLVANRQDTGDLVYLEWLSGRKGSGEALVRAVAADTIKNAQDGMPALQVTSLKESMPFYQRLRPTPGASYDHNLAWEGDELLDLAKGVQWPD